MKEKKTAQKNIQYQWVIKEMQTRYQFLTTKLFEGKAEGQGSG